VSDENVELVRQTYAAWDRGEIEPIVDTADPEIVIVQPPDVPDSKSYRGLEGVIETFEDWPKQWDEFEVKLEEIIDLDERHVISVNRQTLGARGMSLEQEVFFVHTIENGKHLRVDMFLTRQEALDAVEASKGPNR
jgi:ketosteroid isomerase-like protein